jgi:hypothetical protein
MPRIERNIKSTMKERLFKAGRFSKRMIDRPSCKSGMGKISPFFSFYKRLTLGKIGRMAALDTPMQPNLPPPIAGRCCKLKNNHKRHR